MKKIIKVSANFSELYLSKQAPDETGVWGDYQFFINDDSVSDCDYWVFFDKYPDTSTASCDADKLIFVVGEPATIRDYDKRYLSQFKLVVSHREHDHPNVLIQQTALPWHVGVRHAMGTSKIVPVSLTPYSQYSVLKTLPKIEKTRLLSIVSSNKTLSSEHTKRTSFAQKLKDYFGDEIDFFGRGLNQFEDKWDVIAPYKYHICIENSSSDHYFTEKLTDCYLGEAFPIYYGCPNLNDYFSENAYARIDMNDVDGSIQTIRRIIEGDYYEKRYDEILAAKHLALDKYNFFQMIVDVIESQMTTTSGKKAPITVRQEKFYTRKRYCIHRLFNKLLS